MAKKKVENLKKIATALRKDVLDISFRANVGHIGSALSIADIITALYFRIMSVKPKNPKWKNRDRFILSKGHAAAIQYCALAKLGFFSKSELLNFCQNESELAEHPEIHVKGVEVTTGSLGHGLSLGVGMALAGKTKGLNYRVFVLLSDGENDEGSVWEAALAAGHFKLDNLVAIIDYNKLQAFGKIEEVMNLEPLSAKWKAFGWQTSEISGHDMEKVVKTLEKVPFIKGKPSLIVSHSVMGKGISFMEGKLAWHYQSLKETEYKRALKELKDK